MKARRVVLLLLLAMTAAAGTGSALAQWRGPRVGIGINFGVPLYGPGYYAPYYPAPYYYPPAVPYYYPPAVMQAPQNYVEQRSYQAPPQPAAQQNPDAWWYYCADSKTYYPYVKDCPGGWQRVSPTPPG